MRARTRGRKKEQRKKRERSFLAPENKKNAKKMQKGLAKYQSRRYIIKYHGAIAQLARASHWQCEGREFESLLLHHDISATQSSGFFVVFFRGGAAQKSFVIARPAPASLSNLKIPSI